MKKIIDLLIVLFPKFIREQYSETYWLYKSTFTYIKGYINSRIHKEYILVNNIDNLKVEKRLLFTKNNRKSLVNAPLLSTKKGDKFKIKLEDSICDINIYMLKNAFVCGGTDLIGDKNSFYHYELLKMEPQHDLKAHDILGKVNFQNYGNINVLSDLLDLKDKYMIFSNKSIKLNDETIYISLLKEHSINYYHWTTEVLPRLIAVLNVLKANDIVIDDCTILIDEGMPKQIFEMISIVIDTEVKIKIIKRSNIVFCKRIIYCTPLWLSLDNTTGIANPKKEFFLDRYALDIVKDKLISQLNIDVSKPMRKIYLQRLNNKLRPISNLDSLETMLERLGFEFIDVSNLTFREQVILFSETNIVVGVSGAAFTNILYMTDKSYAISLYPSVKSTNYYVFQPLADCAGVNLVHFLTKAKKGEENVHSEASVDITRLEKKILEVMKNV